MLHHFKYKFLDLCSFVFSVETFSWEFRQFLSAKTIPPITLNKRIEPRFASKFYNWYNWTIINLKRYSNVQKNVIIKPYPFLITNHHAKSQLVWFFITIYSRKRYQKHHCSLNVNNTFYHFFCKPCFYQQFVEIFYEDLIEDEKMKGFTKKNLKAHNFFILSLK